jgi:hypothetical protein
MHHIESNKGNNVYSGMPTLYGCRRAHTREDLTSRWDLIFLWLSSVASHLSIQLAYTFNKTKSLEGPAAEAALDCHKSQRVDQWFLLIIRWGLAGPSRRHPFAKCRTGMSSSEQGALSI